MISKNKTEKLDSTLIKLSVIPSRLQDAFLNFVWLPNPASQTVLEVA